VVVEDPQAPGVSGAGVLTVTYGGALPPAAVPGGGVRPHVAVNGPLGAQFLAWEYAVAIAGRVLGVDPFDEPDVAESKDNTAALLAGGLPTEKPTFTESAVQVYTTGFARDLAEVLRELLADVGDDGYLAVTAYLDRYDDAAVHRIRSMLAAASGRPVTFGWGPRYLHSAGQYHKGGPQVGAFLQITGAVVGDLPVPGLPYSFGELQAAQAAGDRRSLDGRGRPVVRLHLSDRNVGVRHLLDVADSLRP
jgi:glucose-6-phosphate isomerase